MEKLVGCENILEKYEEDVGESSGSGRQRPVNVGMPPQLVSRIDSIVKSENTAYSNRSELIRQVIRDRLSELE